MPSGRFVYAANATSWIVFERSGEPFTKKRPASNSMSSADASSRCAAISRPFSRSLRAMTVVAAPATGVERLA